jgi:TonB family protein
MKFPATVALAAALLLAALASAAADPPASLTWLEANKRSAALIKDKGSSKEAADLARQAFDLYPEQATKYSDSLHAQLLLNLVDARNRAEGIPAALRELDRGAEAIAARAGASTHVLVDVFREGARITGATGVTREFRDYSKKVLGALEATLGPDDPRTLKVMLEIVHELRTAEGYAWAAARYREARERAAKTGEDNVLVARADLYAAMLDLEAKRHGTAIKRYTELIERLERRDGRNHEWILQAASAQLQYAYEATGDTAAAEETARRRVDRMLARDEWLVPLKRVNPRYPRAAARDGTEGFVVVEVIVSPDGSATMARVVNSSPRGIFDATTLDAISKWKFQPQVVDGKPIETRGLQRIDYKVEN